MEDYVIPLFWTMYGNCRITAGSFEEAVKIALGPDTPLPDGLYVEDSVAVDYEGAEVKQYSFPDTMTKQNLEAQLRKGRILNDLLSFSAGQNCEIYKADNFCPGGTVIYIPDVCLNHIPLNCPITDPKELDNVLSDCYTGQDFIDECKGNIEKAERLFQYCDWQHPSSVTDELSEEDANESSLSRLFDSRKKFTVCADSINDAMEIARSNYNQGKFVIEAVTPTIRLMMAVDETTGIETEWREF